MLKPSNSPFSLNATGHSENNPLETNKVSSGQNQSKDWKYDPLTKGVNPKDARNESVERENYRTAETVSPSAEEDVMTSNKSDETVAYRKSVSRSQTIDADSTNDLDCPTILSHSSSIS